MTSHNPVQIGKLLVAATVLAAAACSATDAPSAQSGFHRYDSAGISIVVNVDPAVADLPEWTIDTVPALEIGRTSGDAPYLFSRIAGSLRLRDGSFVIGDAESAEIRIFDSSGVFLRKIGRLGSGPGEYINFREVRRYPGDSLMVIDYEGGRANVVALNGQAVRRFRPRPLNSERHQYSSPDLIGIFNDGTMLVGDAHRRCAWDGISAALDPRRNARPAGYCDDSTAIYRLGEDGKVVTNYGPFLSSRSLFSNANNGKQVGLGDITAPLFLRQFGDRFYYVDAELAEIRVYDRERGLTHIFRLPDTRAATVPLLGQRAPRPPGMPVTTSAGNTPIVEVLVGDRNITSSAIATEEERIEAFGSVRKRRFARYFQAMQIDLDGNIWLEDAGTDPWSSGMYGTKRWYIFDSTGVLMAKLTAPNAFVIGVRVFSLRGREIGSNYILAHQSNEGGAPVLHMHRIRKPK